MFRQPNLLTTVRIEAVADGYAIHSPYNPAFVAALKASIAGSDRKWDAARKVWVVAHSQGQAAVDLIASYYNESVSLPQATGAPTSPEMRLLDVRYIGAAKTREDGQETAFGWSGGQWSVIFPKPVLLEWFGQTSRPDEAQTLYGVLGVSQSVSPDELKKAWKRLAMHWHPDRAKEPGAKEQFQIIQETWQILSDPIMRAKYDAGLKLEAMSKAHSKGGHVNSRSVIVEWRAPLRCGLVLAEGQSRLGRFVVSKVLQWADITNERGETLVTSWQSGNDMFTETWIL